MKNDTSMQGILLFWKSLLGLSDWTIKLKTDCYSSEMTLQNVVGETEWSESIKAACIRIRSEAEYGDRIVPYDAEKTLVHELLHLKFCLIGESGNDLQDRYVHQLIDDLARALVGAYRASPNPSTDEGDKNV